MPLEIMPVYAGLLALLFAALSLQVIRNRIRARVSIGAGGDRILQRAMRVHGNFAEYVPLILILIGAAELMGTEGWVLHLLGASLFIGRILHAIGLGREPDRFRYRRFGIYLNHACLIGAAVLCLFLSISRTVAAA